MRIKHKAKACIQAVSAVFLTVTLTIVVKAAPRYLSADTTFEYGCLPYSHLTRPNTAMINGKRNFEEDVRIKFNTAKVLLSNRMPFLKSKATMITRLSYGWLGIKYCDWDFGQSGNFRPNDLHSFTYSTMLIRRVSSTRHLVIIAAPGLASDLKGDLTSKDTSFMGAVGMKKRYKTGISLTYGLAYIYDFGRPYPIPFLGIEWTDGDKLSASLMGPRIKFTYEMSDSKEFGFDIKMSGNRYNISSNSNSGLNDPKVEYSVATIGPRFKFAANERMDVNLEAGTTLRRKLRFMDGDDEIRNLDQKNTIFLKASITFKSKKDGRSPF